MLYSLYELGHLSVAPLRIAAMMQSNMLRSPLNPAVGSEAARAMAAASDLFETVTRRYRKPAWDLATTLVEGASVAVTPKPAWASPWCTMLHFERDADAMRKARGARTDPTVLIVAPMSGHYATLLRGTVEAFLPEHEVYITDWADARQVPVLSGRFDYHDYIDHVMAMLRALGPDTHVVAVCQPGPPVLAAISMLAQEGDPCTPATMTYMGSPIDARRSPTAPNLLAERRSIEWFQKNMIHTVPAIYPGGFRRVYPGFLQLASFMGMNLSRHVDAHHDYFQHLIQGDGDSAQRHRDFYDEYLSVMDLSEEFYVQTLREVFQEYSLAKGEFVHRDVRVDPGAIVATGLLTVEGELDDISGIGQTQAAHDLCTGLPEGMREDYIQPGVGHYGVFNGRRFQREIYPRMRRFIRAFQSPATRKAGRRLKVVGE
ncbi:MAG TPA: polyhydroxyalkanoate depolymerase [Hyphomonadaceae bacterium]|nr:polyhydroxyalkanoate depolymerase [Hyphomonadaceae bacterium]